MSPSLVKCLDHQILKPAACVAACAAYATRCSAHGHAHRACVLRLLRLLICLFQGNVVDVQVCAVTLALKAATE